MIDTLLRDLLLQIEETRRSQPLTLYVVGGSFCGRAVRRDVYLEALEELAVKSERGILKTLARGAADTKEPPGAIAHLVDTVFVAGTEAVEPRLTSENGRSVFALRPPTRVRLRHIIAWHPGNPFESAR